MISCMLDMNSCLCRCVSTSTTTTMMTTTTTTMMMKMILIGCIYWF